MKIRKMLIGCLLIVVGVPVALIALGVAWMSFLNKTNGAIVSSGVKREYLLYVPLSYDRAKPAPLIISLHGAAGWAAQQKNVSGWNALADREGFIVVYPSGSGTPRIWSVDHGPGLARDVRFISELIDTLAASYNIDRARIYANGLSNGGGMTFVLSCTLSNRIAAFGMASAAHTLEWSWCTDRRPVPVIEFHGTADPIVPYGGGLPTSAFAPTKFDPNARPFPNMPAWAASWAQRNGCASQPADTTVAANVTRREYTGCANGASVVLYTLEGAGHQWPGGKQLPQWWVGPPSTAVDATKLMWQFFREHPLVSEGDTPGAKR